MQHGLVLSEITVANGMELDRNATCMVLNIIFDFRLNWKFKMAACPIMHSDWLI